MVSAESLFAAISKEVLVLVDASKKRFITVFPLRVGTFLMSLPRTSLKDSADSRISLISSEESDSISSMSFLLRPIVYTPGMKDKG